MYGNGPWTVYLPDERRVIRLATPDYPWTAICTVNPKLPDGEAIGRLISCAPELLAALETAQEYLRLIVEDRIADEFDELISRAKRAA
jgi:hypothetical protein